MKSRPLLTCLLVWPLAACASEEGNNSPSPVDAPSSAPVAPVAPSSMQPAAPTTPANVPQGTPSVSPSSPGSETGGGGTGAGPMGSTPSVPGTTGPDAVNPTGDTGDDETAPDDESTGPGGAPDTDAAAAPTDSSGDGGVDGDVDSGPTTDGPAASGEDIPCEREFTIPSFQDLEDNAKMPDPFTFLDGSKVETKADWVCRQKEISLLAQAFIYGRKPPKPETLTATYSDGTLKVDMAEGDRTYSLSVNITTPNGDGPVPAVFNVDGSGGPQGMASIGTSLQWLTSNVASAPMYSRNGGGAFYDFHPEYTDTGSLMAWAWAASRILDGLELTVGQHNIDPAKTFGLGCSRNGKTSATMALFDRRMAMVAMYSPGSGTTSGWRVAEAQTSDVQTAQQIYGETTWMGEPFGQFGNQVNKLPIDQHEVLALAWPRPLLVREGTQDSWNCPVCVYTTVKYTQMIFEALGSKDAVGLTHYNGGHCANGGQEWSTLFNAFVEKYLHGDDSVSTAGMFTESFQFDAARWQGGDVPAAIE